MHYFGVFIVTFNMSMPAWDIIEKLSFIDILEKNVLNLLKQTLPRICSESKIEAMVVYSSHFFSVFLF